MTIFKPSRSAARVGRKLSTLIITASLGLAFASPSYADVAAPAFSSNPGAAYTIYLDFGGFAYTGTWAGATPGTTPAYDNATGSFSPQEIADIKAVWAGVSMQYAGLNVNVTTVDPATGANDATDAARQTFYANTPNLMHTVIGSAIRGNTNWTPNAGVSFTGTTVGAENSSDPGGHTNWIITQNTDYNEAGDIHFIAQDATHENGHGLGLSHQSDFVGTTLVNDYGLGDNTNGGGDPPITPDAAKPGVATHAMQAAFRGVANASAVGPLATTAQSSTGPGTYGEIMGNGDYAQRLTWRVGSTSGSSTGAVQNDVAKILTTNTAANATALGRTGGVDLHLTNDGIGHTMATASDLALISGSVDFNLAKGVIVPASESAPNPTGKANYTSDYFSFTLAGTSTISLTMHDGSELVTPGVADSQVTLRSTMEILNAAGTVVGTATEAADTLSETFTNQLTAGKYTIEVDSYGGHNEVDAAGTNFNPATMYDMGSFFLTGSGFDGGAVPEPGTVYMGAFGLCVVIWQVRRRSRRA